MKGAILSKGENFYTYMSHVFHAIYNAQKDYNWLITALDAYPSNPEFERLPDADYTWMTGDELTDMVEKEDFQWIWGVLSGFPKNITQEQTLQYNLPYADGYRGFWKNPVTIQHPLAVTEIVQFDSSLVLVISKQDKIVEDFLVSMPLAEDLEVYNSQKQL